MTDDGDNVVSLADRLDGGEGEPQAPPPAPKHFKRLPDDCPVAPLGRCTVAGGHGHLFAYLSPAGEVCELPDGKHGRLHLAGLAAPYEDWFIEQYPRRNKDGVLVGADWGAIASALTDACARQPIWIGREQVRGRGGWRDDDDGLLLHCGDGLVRVPRYASDGTPHRRAWDCREYPRPGRRGRYIYPRQASTYRPIVGRKDVHAEIADMVRVLDGWAWRRSGLDPELQLGLMAAGIAGAALDFRPIGWITGGAGCGKTTLRNWQAGVFGADGCISTGDATAAGLRQALRESSLPVLFDEIEPEPGSNWQTDLLKLARLAASGDQALRGTADHTGAGFQIRSMIQFSSIRVPALDAAVWSRIVVCQLEPLAETARPPDMTPARLRAFGGALRRRVCEVWPRLPDALAQWKETLRGVGHDARGCDVWGTVLAFADLVIRDTVAPAEQRAAIAGAVAPARLVNWIGEAGGHHALIDHIMSQVVETTGSSKELVSRLLRDAAGWSRDIDPVPAGRYLARVGLRVQYQRRAGGSPEPMLLISRNHGGLFKLLRGTIWEPRPGHTSVMLQDLEQLAALVGGVPSTAPASFGGAKSRAVALPLAAVLDQDDDEREGLPPAPAEDAGAVFHL